MILILILILSFFQPPGWASFYKVLLPQSPFILTRSHCQKPRFLSRIQEPLHHSCEKLKNVAKNMNFSQPLPMAMGRSTSGASTNFSQPWEPCVLDQTTTDCDKDCPLGHKVVVHGVNAVPIPSGRCVRSNCFSLISFTVQSSFKTMAEIHWEKTTVGLLGEIGGHMGLFLGVSVLTLIEFVEFLLHWIPNYVVGVFASRSKKSKYVGSNAVDVANQVWPLGSNHVTNRPINHPTDTQWVI